MELGLTVRIEACLEAWAEAWGGVRGFYGLLLYRLVTQQDQRSPRRERVSVHWRERECVSVQRERECVCMAGGSDSGLSHGLAGVGVYWIG